MTEPGSTDRPSRLPALPGRRDWLRPWALAATLQLLLAPAGAIGADFCAPPAAPRGWASANRVFHGAPQIESLTIGRAAAIACRMVPGQPGANCGAVRLLYAPWDPVPELARVSLQHSDRSHQRPWRAQAQGVAATVVNCTPLSPWRGEANERSLRVRSQRDLQVRFPAPLGLVVIRESFLSHHPIVNELIEPAAGRRP